MKTTMYFKTVEEMENYFPDGVPNNILAVIEGEGSNVLFTSTNNTEQGEAVEQGGYITDPADKARIDALEEGKADKSDVYTKTEVDTKIQNVEVDLTGYATETYVTATVQNVVGAAPAALDTLKEIGDALNNDADFAGTMTTALAGKANAADVYNKSEVDAKIAGIDVDFDETDPTVPSYVKNITEANINSWSSKLSTESDPIYSASPAANITSERMAIWDAKVSNVQGDWYESDSSSEAYILNKPNIKGFGLNSISEGFTNLHTVSNVYGAHCEGYQNRVGNVANYSHVEGRNNSVTNENEHAEGQYNISTKTSNTFGNAGNTAFSHGIGLNLLTRKNAVEIMENGDFYAYGVGNYDGTNATAANSYTISYVINDLQDQIDNIPAGGTQADWNESDSTSNAYIKNKPSDLVNQNMLNTVFSQQATRSLAQNTYTGQVVDYISYLNLASSSDLDNMVTWDAEPVTCNTDAQYYGDENLFAVTFANVPHTEDANGIDEISLIIGNPYNKTVNDADYECVVGLGMIRKAGRDESYSIPAVIDTFYEMPDNGAKSPVEPVLKQTYKELATKDYVDTQLGDIETVLDYILNGEAESESEPDPGR